MENSEVHPFIEGKLIDLLPLDSNHVDLYSKWENDPKVRKYARTEIPVTVEESKKYLEPSKGSVRTRIMFEIWHKKDKKPIGFCEFDDIFWSYRIANIGYLIGDVKYWGKGIGTELVKLLLEYGFNELDLHKITVDVVVPNVSSIRCLEKNGFRLEGTLKKEMYIDGKYYDILKYGLLKEEWIKSNH